jgi:hypothetical protein
MTAGELQNVHDVAGHGRPDPECDAQTAPPPMRIVEISRAGFFKALTPETTRWLRWGSALTADEPNQPAASAFGLLARFDYDLIVLPAIHPGHRYDQSWLKLAAKSVLDSASRSATCSRLLNRFIGDARHIIVDLRDERELCDATLRLFPRACRYFKRELDFDHPADPIIEPKLRPLPLFLPDERYAPLPHEKDIDIFFSGALTNEIRVQAVKAASALAARGLRVVVLSNPLPYSDFMASLARSWLVLSPEGFGWDCYRHYEACLAGAVPVINRPRYRRPLYLQEGVHCFYYDVFREALEDRLLSFITDKARLQQMAEDGRKHVLANHTRSAVARYMLNEISKSA